MPVDPPASELPRSRLRLPDGISRRAVGITVALAIEALILLILLFGLGISTGPASQDVTEVTTFDATEASEEAESEAEEDSAAEPEQEEAPTAEVEPQPQPEAPSAAPALPPTALPRESPLPSPPPAPPPPQPQAAPSAPATPRARAVIRSGGGTIGPANTGSRNGPDTQIVGTAPDGSPLYAARWFTEPTSQQLAGFMDGARGPGWGLIACKTAPNWRVEDCVVVGESPAGSNIASSFKLAAWQFLVRPPRVGGEYLIGSWVRIRLDYSDIQVGSRTP